jgi:LacI family transcriptional regulator
MTEARPEALRKRPSISDVALEAGVSKAAVSKVIRDAYGVSPAMKERVDAAIQRLEYRPRVSARAMRGASFTVGFEIPHLGNDYFTQVMQGAADTLHNTQYQLMIAPGVGTFGGKEVIESLIDRQVDGVVAVSSDVTTDQLERLAQQVPMVVLGRRDPSPHYDTVVGDDALGAHLAMDHLLELGHTRIAHLTIQPANEWAPQAVRSSVYEEVMLSAGLEAHVVISENTEHDAYATAHDLLTGPTPPTAIFAAHDALAIGVQRAAVDLAHHGMPVSVVGYDGIDIAAHPLISLTTVDQSGTEMGAAAITLLMEQIRDKRTEPRQHVIRPRLRVGRSTGPPAR